MAFRPLVAIATALVLAVPLAGAALYVGKRVLRSTSAAYAQQPALEPVRVGPRRLNLNPAGAGRYRLLLDDATLSALQASAKAKTQIFERVRSHCGEHLAKTTPAGYEAFNWADAVAELGLCWHATQDERYAQGALRYLNALLDDRFKVGDGKGGDRTVRYDSGYGIRTFGVYSALGYDWLRDAPGMTPELRRRIIQRLKAWLDWYHRDGYLKDEPVANYFWGYLTALTFAGLAVGDDAPEGRQ